MLPIADIIHRTTVVVLSGVTVYAMIGTGFAIRERMALAKERKREREQTALAGATVRDEPPTTPPQQ